MMLSYYLQLAIRNLRRNVALTALMVVVVGFGIGASMTVLTTLRAMGADPIPDKSSQLFVPQIDAWGPPTRPGGGTDASGRLPDQLTYRDAMALMRAHRAVRQTAMYAVSLDATAADGTTFPVRGRAAYSDFFRMFEVPFRAGRPWTQDDDNARANVVVLTAKLADRLFLHANPVGSSINLSDREYRIVGVLGGWNPVPLFYDLTNGGGLRANGVGLSDTEDVFLPFSTAIDRQMEINGSYSCNAGTAPGFEGHLTGECLWLQYWAELPTAAAARDYKAFLYNYSAQQRQLGRFHWTPRVELPDLRRWMVLEISVPDTLRVSSAVAFGFLAVCLINTAGLMLARFSVRAGELGVRRALGASRLDIFLQCVVETAIVGVPGALVGLGLTAAGPATQRTLHMIAGSAAAVSRETALDGDMMLITLVLAMCAMVCSALYPVWRASRVQPAWQLKSQ